MGNFAILYLHLSNTPSSNILIFNLNFREKGNINRFFKYILTWNRWCKGPSTTKINPQKSLKKKSRSSLNNSEINNFIEEDQDNQVVNNPNLRVFTDNTQQQTPLTEKRELERPVSISSEEEHKISKNEVK